MLSDVLCNETKESFFSYKIGSLENKREKIMELLNMVIVNQRNHRMEVNDNLNQSKLLAAEIMGTLKKEYHLE